MAHNSGCEYHHITKEATFYDEQQHRAYINFDQIKP